VLIGGQASPRDSAPPPAGAAGREPPAAKRFDSAAPQLRQRYEAQWLRLLTRHYRRQEAALISRIPKTLAPVAGNGRAKVTVGGVWFDEERWNAELSADLFALNRATALAWSQHTIDQVGITIDDMDAYESIMLPWLEEHSRAQAEGINAHVRGELAVALAEPEPADAVRHMFEVAVTAWAVSAAVGAVTAAANFGSSEAASAGGLRTKTWRVNSGNPRPSHAALNGVTVGIRERFPNGQRWPGDPAGGAEENSNCQCSVDFN
jgi:hypothetical protein